MFLYLQANIKAPATHKPITAPSASAQLQSVLNCIKCTERQGIHEWSAYKQQHHSFSHHSHSCNVRLNLRKDHHFTMTKFQGILVYYISIEVQTPNFYVLSIQIECCRHCLCIGSWSEYYFSMVTDNLSYFILTQTLFYVLLR